jgi:nucleoside-diphosphate-sugar epimerase
MARVICAATSRPHLPSALVLPTTAGARKLFFRCRAASTIDTPSGSSTAAEKKRMTVFVAGSTGRTGKRVVEKLLARGFGVVAGTTDVGRARGSLPQDANLQLVDNFGTVNLVEACRKAGVTRFILVSSILVNGVAMGQILNPAYIVLNLLGLTLVAKLQAEKHIRGSGINYTIVRPGGLTDQPPTGNIIMDPEDTLYTGSISREQVAEVAVEALLCPEASFKVVEIVSGAEAPNRPLKDMFAAIKQN